MTATTGSEDAAVTVAFGVRHSRGVLFGQTTSQLAIEGTGFLAALAALRTDSLDAAAAWLAVVACCAALAWVPVRGRHAAEYVPIYLAWWTRRLSGQDLYAGGPYRMTADEAVLREPRLPGSLSDLVWQRYQTGDGPVAVLKDRRAGTYTGVLALRATTFALLEGGEQCRRVEAYGAMLDALCREDSPLARLQLLERTVPDSAGGLQRDLAAHGDPAAPAVARAAYAELIATPSAFAQRHETYLAVSLDKSRGSARERIAAHGGGDSGAAAALYALVSQIIAGLTAAGVDVVGWLPPRGLAAVLRSAFDPASSSTVDRRAGGHGDEPGGDGGLPSGVDPRLITMYGQPRLDHYQTDTAYHRTYWVLEWPRVEVPAGFLQPLLLNSRYRRTVSLTMEPVPPRRAPAGRRRRRQPARRRTALAPQDRPPGTASRHRRRRSNRAPGTGTHGRVRHLPVRRSDHGHCELTARSGAGVRRGAQPGRPVAVGSRAAGVPARPRLLRWCAPPGSEARMNARSSWGRARRISAAEPSSARDLLRRHRRMWLGPPGPAAGRVLFPLRLPAHQETTAQLRGTYPFLAGTSLPTMGMYIGQERFTRSSFCFDPFRLYAARVLSNPSVFLAGVIGSGKSSLAKTLLLRALAFGYRFVVPGDVRGEYQPLARAIGVTPLVLGPGISRPLNPLSRPATPPGMDAGQWWDIVRAHWEALLDGIIRAALPGQRELTPVESAAVELALDRVTGTGAGDPARAAPACLPRLMDALFEPDDEAARELRMSQAEILRATADVALVVRRLVHGSLRGLVAGTERTTFDTAQPGVVVDLSRVRVANDAGMALAMACVQSMMELATLFDRARRIVVYDELWRLVAYPGLIARVMAGIKLTRDTGTAHLLITHRISDLLSGAADSEKLALGLLADCSTRIIYRQASDQVPATARALELTPVEAAQLPLLGQGTSLWKVERRSYLVDHTVLRDGLEWPIIDTDQAMTDDYRHHRPYAGESA